MSEKIRDLNSLELEIAALGAKKKLLESKLDANLNHLRNNFMSMAYRSVVPGTKSGTGPMNAAGDFLKTQLKSEKLKEGFSKLAGSFTAMASEGVESFMDKFQGKKHEKPS